MKSNDLFLKSTFNRYLPPTMLCVLGGTVNVFFDGVLIGSLVGEAGLLAVNLCLPIVLAFCTIGSLIASGASVRSAQEMGRNDLDGSRRIFGAAIVLALTLGVLFSAVGLVLIDAVVKLIGGGASAGGLRNYVFIILCGGTARVLLYIPFFYLRLDGRNAEAAAVMLAMMGVNIALDVLWMGIFPMGIAGAAYASVTATLAACALGFLLLFRRGSSFSLPLSLPKPFAAFNILKTGTPSALNNLASAFRILIINILLLSVAGGAYAVLFAVVTAISEFSLFIVNGVPQTALPIISVYSAEKSNGGIRLLMKRQLIAGMIGVGAFGLMLALGHRAIAGIFGVSQSLRTPLAYLSLSLLLGQINSIMTYYFNAVGRIALADTITLFRILVLPIAFLSLLLAGDAALLWLFLPLSELFTLLIWLGAARIISTRKGLSRVLLLDDALERSGSAADFSVKSHPDDICYASKCIGEFCKNNAMTPGQTLRISLAIEEIMTVMAEKSIGNAEGSFDVRAFSAGGAINLRIRCAGARFNPLPLCGKEGAEADESLMGIRMLSGMVKKLHYIATFGVNSFFVQIQ